MRPDRIAKGGRHEALLPQKPLICCAVPCVQPSAAVAKAGDHLIGGDVLGTVQETPSILHKIMMPPKMSGTVKEIKSGSFTVEDVVAVIETDKGETKELTMIQKWPVRVGRILLFFLEKLILF